MSLNKSWDHSTNDRASTTSSLTATEIWDDSIPFNPTSLAIQIDENTNYIGIGTSNPSCPLNVKSNDNEPIAKFEGDRDTIVLIQSNLTNGADEVGIAIKGDSAKEEYWFVGTEDITNSDNNLHFAASSSIHIPSEDVKMTLSRDGNVGIGTSAPTHPLTITKTVDTSETVATEELLQVVVLLLGRGTLAKFHCVFTEEYGLPIIIL